MVAWDARAVPLVQGLTWQEVLAAQSVLTAQKICLFAAAFILSYLSAPAAPLASGWSLAARPNVA